MRIIFLVILISAVVRAEVLEEQLELFVTAIRADNPDQAEILRMVQKISMTAAQSVMTYQNDPYESLYGSYANSMDGIMLHLNAVANNERMLAGIRLEASNVYSRLARHRARLEQLRIECQLEQKSMQADSEIRVRAWIDSLEGPAGAQGRFT